MMDALCAQFKNPALEVKNLHIQDEWGNRSSKIKKILQKKKKTETCRNWYEKLPFALFAYQTSI